MSEILRFQAGSVPLVMKRTAPTVRLDSPSRPVLIVPGYGMNSFIFGYHPGPDRSLEAALAARGLEVYSLDLRGQGRSRESGKPSSRYGLADLALVDLPRAIEEVLATTETGRSEVDLLGCSLGAALVFAMLAHRPTLPVRSIVSHGGLVTWESPPLLLRVALGSPRLVGMVPVRGTRALARVALPLLASRAPKLLSLYLRTESTNVADPLSMVQTVEDPSRHVNREIAEWLRARRLVVGGVDVSASLAGMTRPLLVVMANQDGIVPPETSRALFREYGGADKELLAVGSASWPIAHADLFLATGAETAIFAPIADFLLGRAMGGGGGAR